MKAFFNEAQREAVSWYFSPENDEGEPWLVDEAVEIRLVPIVVLGRTVDYQLFLNGCYLHTDGEWHPDLERPS